MCRRRRSEGGSWAECPLGPHEYEATERGPKTYGPARQVSARPFAVVWGTIAASAGSNRAMHASGMYIANLHAMAADTRVIAVTDMRALGFAQPSPSLKGLNRIVIGGPNQNLFLRSKTINTAVRWDGDGRGFEIHGMACAFRGPGIGIIYLAPLWEGEDGGQGDERGGGGAWVGGGSSAVWGWGCGVGGLGFGMRGSWVVGRERGDEGRRG